MYNGTSLCLHIRDPQRPFETTNKPQRSQPFTYRSSSTSLDTCLSSSAFCFAGVGLLSVRGSGTSGHVQTNKFNLRGPAASTYRSDRDQGDGKPNHRTPNDAILEHNRKREIEIQVEQLRDQLEEDGLGEEEIERRLTEYREELKARFANASNGPPGGEKDARDRDRLEQDTHQVALRKAQQMERLRGAFGFREDIAEGEAFDKELQERKRLEKLAAREDARQRREQEAKRLEKERRKRQRLEEEERREAERKRRREAKRQKTAAEDAHRPPRTDRRGRKGSESSSDVEEGETQGRDDAIAAVAAEEERAKAGEHPLDAAQEGDAKQKETRLARKDEDGVPPRRAASPLKPRGSSPGRGRRGRIAASPSSSPSRRQRKRSSSPRSPSRSVSRSPPRRRRQASPPLPRRRQRRASSSRSRSPSPARSRKRPPRGHDRARVDASRSPLRARSLSPSPPRRRRRRSPSTSTSSSYSSDASRSSHSDTSSSQTSRSTSASSDDGRKRSGSSGGGSTSYTETSSDRSRGRSRRGR
jgi:serine/arginine repetitive matrix protein 2